MRSIVLVGASTGAPRTHHFYLNAMPADFPAPVVIVQHMPRGPFMEGILRYLRDTIRQPVRLAQDGDVLHAGEVFLANPGTHVRFDGGSPALRVAPEEGENAFAPSMDVTFSSAAQVFRRRCYVAMLSGLHADHDGLRGCVAVRQAGGRVIVSDRATTPCYTMVQQVRDAGAYDDESPLDQVLTVISRWIGS